MKGQNSKYMWDYDTMQNLTSRQPQEMPDGQKLIPIYYAVA